MYFSWFAPTQQELSEPRLHEVNNIYVGNMGDADEADRLRLLLEEQVAKKGFRGCRFTGEGGRQFSRGRCQCASIATAPPRVSTSRCTRQRDSGFGGAISAQR